MREFHTPPDPDIRGLLVALGLAPNEQRVAEVRQWLDMHGAERAPWWASRETGLDVRDRWVPVEECRPDLGTRVEVIGSLRVRDGFHATHLWDDTVFSAITCHGGCGFELDPPAAEKVYLGSVTYWRIPRLPDED